MKYCLNRVYLLLLFIILVHNSTNSKKRSIPKSLVKLYSKQSKFVKCATKPIRIKCKNCLNNKHGFKPFFFYEIKHLNKYVYKFMINYNDKKKTILLSFSGPSVDNHDYIKYIYSSGWKNVRKYSIRIERDFYDLYFGKIRKILLKKVRKVLLKGRKRYKFHFTGHGLGGSIATLASFDLTKSKVIKKRKNNTMLMTFGQLRIGCHCLIRKLNKTLSKIYRITKNNDYIVRIPNCFYSNIVKKWRCFTNKVINKYIKSKSFPLKNYFRRYLSIFKKRKVKKSKQIKLYLNHIFYTQPLGTQIMYDSSKKRFKTCKYNNNGISNCEKKIKIPISFTSKQHSNYFGINFNKCE